MKKVFFIIISLWACISVYAQRREYTPSAVTGSAWNTPGNLNPFIPGYFADPTIRKFGDTYYLYATTDGTGNGYGPAQVWVSKDFRNWKNVILNWPTTEVVWAPDVVQQNDTTFRYYYCEPCNVNIGESRSPLGPWHNILGKTDAVMVPDRYVHNVITLDPQLFRDDDGSEYLYFTTWGIYDGFGCGCAKLNKGWSVNDIDADLADARYWHEGNPFPIQADKFFSEKRLIPNTELKNIFEAPFVFKRNGVYYFTYSSGSCHTDTYHVQYATSTQGPMGPFTYQGELLTTNADGTVHGPGHHSILEDGEHYYIIYHRHDIAKAIHGFNRQVCIDELHFTDDGKIQRVTPTHDGLLPASLATNSNSKNSCENLAYGAKVTASSYYSEQFKPDYAVDDNNATLWKAARCNDYDSSDGLTHEWIQIDLGKVMTFNEVWTQFEYATFFYQYHIETSVDGKNWTPYAIKDATLLNKKGGEANVTAGSPMIDEGKAKARYLRITITDTQKNGHFPAIWNVKVFNASKKNDPKRLLPSTEGMDYAAVEAAYPALHKKDVDTSERLKARERGYRVLSLNADAKQQPEGWTVEGADDIIMEPKAGKWAFYFDGNTVLRSASSMPHTMTYNAPYTIAAWVYNPTVEGIETILECTERRNDLSTIEFRQGMDPQNGLVAHNASFENFGNADACQQAAGAWHHWVDTYDGYMERIYLDGKLLMEKNSFLMIRPEGKMTLGGSFDGGHRFTGYLHSIDMWDRPFATAEVDSLYRVPSSTTDKLSFDATNLFMAAKAITPTLAKVTITDQEGGTVRSGSLRYNGHATPSYLETLPASLTQKRKSATPRRDAPYMLMCVITNDEGDTLTTLHVPVRISSETFDTFTQSDEQRLSATTPDFNEDPAQNGANLLTEATGNFVMQCRVSDMDGSDRHVTPAYNEGGLIIYSDAKHFVQLGVFPNYNCGNMLTVFSPREGRPQFPNQKGWRYDPWLQLERNENTLHARTSADGINWTEMPGSPVEISRLLPRDGSAETPLRLGIYQTTYTDHKSWVKFSDFTVWKKH